MRVCLVCSEYPPAPHGGIGSVVRLLAHGLQRQGHEVRVAGCVSPGCPAPEFELDDGIQVHRLREGAFPLAWVHARVRLYRLLRRWATAGEIDIVEVPDWGAPAACWPRLPCPVVVRLHGSATYFAAELGQTAPALTCWLERRAMRRADAICAASAYAGEQTRALFGTTVAMTTVHNAVDVPPPVARARPCAGQRRRVLFSGTLTAKKGVEPLVRAWPAVVARHPAAELHLYGRDGYHPAGGSMRAQLERILPGAVRASVHFHGAVERGLLLAELATADVAVFPSLAESFALAPLEAMACGCPTIYSTRGSGRELVEDGVDGLLVEPDDPAQIADAIDRLLADPELAQRLGEAGRRCVQERFSTDVMARRTAELYAGCVAVGRGPQAVGTPARRRRCRDARLLAENVVVDRDWSHEPDGRPLLRGCAVAICTYRRAQSLSRFVDSLARQDAVPAQLLVVDASPDDATERMLAAHPALGRVARRVDYVRVAGPLRGLTRQRNLALDRTTGEMVAFFDDDVVLLPDCLSVLARTLQDSAGALVGVSAVIVNEQAAPSALWWTRRAVGIVPSLRAGSYTRSGMSVPWHFLPPGEGVVAGDWLQGATTIWRTAVAREVGFEEGLDGYANGEDLEFSLRMRRHGGLARAAGARLQHLHEPAGRPDAYLMGYMGLRNLRHVHHSCLPERTWRDDAYFVYAFSLDTFVRLAALAVRPGSVRERWAFLRGRMRYLAQWAAVAAGRPVAAGWEVRHDG